MSEFELLSLLGISVILFTSSVNECMQESNKWICTFYYSTIIMKYYIK
ncbi:unnamed protein product [Callosobruchus maculatus]|uniref:Uncharacterized protein n=1 Tax=Callosobruchus maculatus TaxID=64391 RepID=A0A653D766_CALMS|nr:unnamed protein product [Callosobruchus maculatus]